MHCKCLVFLLIVFFFFSFFSSACEFRFIERIGAHGKQNPDFIIIIQLHFRKHHSKYWLLLVNVLVRLLSLLI